MRGMPRGMREKVLSASELFADHGLDATKMEDIAAATGVPKATLYYHFEGKEAILAFLFTEVLDELEAAVGAATRTGGSAAERLHAVVIAHLGVISAFPAASRALQFDLGRAARLPAIADRVEAAFLGPVRSLLVEGGTDGSLRPTDHPGLVATAILGTIVTTGIGALSAPTPGSQPSALGPDALAEELAGFILRGLGS